MDQLNKNRFLNIVVIILLVANLTTFLLSDASRWITGKKFTLDGGILLSSAK